MLSDFGTSRDTLSAPATRTGNTGTLEFAAPETLRRAPGGALRPADSHVDMWSLGMVIHMLLFFALPYDAASQYARDRGAALTGPERLERLEHELLAYPGYATNAL
jgi:serine/threonine protein kinase